MPGGVDSPWARIPEPAGLSGEGNNIGDTRTRTCLAAGTLARSRPEPSGSSRTRNAEDSSGLPHHRLNICDDRPKGAQDLYPRSGREFLAERYDRGELRIHALFRLKTADDERSEQCAVFERWIGKDVASDLGWHVAGTGNAANIQTARHSHRHGQQLVLVSVIKNPKDVERASRRIRSMVRLYALDEFQESGRESPGLASTVAHPTAPRIEDRELRARVTHDGSGRLPGDIVETASNGVKAVSQDQRPPLIRRGRGGMHAKDQQIIRCPLDGNAIGVTLKKSSDCVCEYLEVLLCPTYLGDGAIKPHLSHLRDKRHRVAFAKDTRHTLAQPSAPEVASEGKRSTQINWEVRQ